MNDNIMATTPKQNPRISTAATVLIVLLCLSAIFCVFIDASSGFVRYWWPDGDKLELEFNIYGWMNLIYYFPLNFCVTMPCFLLVLYVLFFQKKFKPKSFFVVCCCLLAVVPFFEFFNGLVDFWCGTFVEGHIISNFNDGIDRFIYLIEDIQFMSDWYIFTELSSYVLSIGRILGFITSIGFVLYGINAIRGFKGRALVIVGFLLAFSMLGYELLAYCLRLWHYFKNEFYLYIFIRNAFFTGKFFVYVSMLIYSLSYRKACIKASAE